ncbi:MAG: hypothetical protein LCH88_09010 [Proteobacteria bacterium]|nr:hypothetical protein [Pseudomonadota bacterium]
MTRNITISASIELVTEQCCNCGMAFAMTADFKKRRLKDRQSFYCPAGHSQHYTGKSKEDQLAEELSRERQRLARYADMLGEEGELRRAAERRASAARGQVTRLKKRAAAGVCPCCNRTFTNLARHMAGQHPGFKAEPVDGDNVVPLRAQS